MEQKRDMKRHKIIMKVSEAIERLSKITGSKFAEELSVFPPNFWLVEGDHPDENGKPEFFIVEDTPENNKALSGHTPVDLTDYGVEV